jgi:flagellar biosynthesis protein FliR
MDFLPAKIFIFILVLTRVSAFFLALPIFGSPSIPANIRAAMVTILAIFFSIFLPSAPVMHDRIPIEMIILVCSEACIGLMMGVVVACVFGVIKIAGEMAEREMGLTLSEVLDPMTGESGQPVALLLEMFFILMFFSADGHLMFIRMMHKSFMIFSPGSFADIPAMTEAVLNATSVILIASLRLAAPIFGAFLLLTITLAVLARITPEMDILFISLPMKVALGLMMLAFAAPLINDFVAEFADWMSKLLPM